MVRNIVLPEHLVVFYVRTKFTFFITKALSGSRRLEGRILVIYLTKSCLQKLFDVIVLLILSRT
jgi:hypothetical protein